jgi:hypothetical protein
MGACTSKKSSDKKSTTCKQSAVPKPEPQKPKTNIEKLLQQKTEPVPKQPMLSEIVEEIYNPRR